MLKKIELKIKAMYNNNPDGTRGLQKVKYCQATFQEFMDTTIYFQ